VVEGLCAGRVEEERMASSTASGRAPQHGAPPGRASTPPVGICAAGEGLCVGCVKEGLYVGRAGVERMANSAAGEGLCADCIEEGAPRRGGSLRRPRRGGAHGQQHRVEEGLCAAASRMGAWAIAPRRIQSAINIRPSAMGQFSRKTAAASVDDGRGDIHGPRRIPQ
jgi:hypothetical protein